MLFTFKQFQQTKAQLVKEFHQQPVIELCATEDKQNEYEYIKLLNSVKYRKIEKSRGNLNKVHTTRIFQNSQDHVKISSLRSTITRRQKKLECKKQIQYFSKPFMKPNFLNSFTQQQKPTTDQFYLTGLLIQSKVKETQLQQGERHNQKKLTILSLQKEQDQPSVALSGETEQLVNLRVKIFEVGQQEKYLNEQICELQQSIRYYKQLNASLEVKISDSTRRWNSSLKAAIRKQSDLNQRDSKNRYFEQKFMSTENFFSKSLKSIKCNKNAQTRQCEEMVDDLAERILTKKFLGKRIESQKLQIGKMEEKAKYKQKRIEESLNACAYSQVLEKLIQQLNNMKSNWYCKKQVFRHKKTGSNGNFMEQSILKKLYELEESQFIHIVKDIIKTYNRLKSDQEKLRSIYQYKIYELEQYRSLYQQKYGYLDQNFPRINTCESLKKFISSKMLSEGKGLQTPFKDYPLLEMKNFSGDTFIDQIKKLQEKTKKANDCILGLKQKSKFFVKKLIKFTQKIVGRWLKYDQSAINFLANIVDRFVCIFPFPTQQVNYPQAKDIMAEHFQNWELYSFFSQEICNNAMIHNSVTEEEIVRGIRRCIKTKVCYPKTNTPKILTKLIIEWYNKYLEKNYSMIEDFAKLGKEIMQYCSKYQVFIVNVQQASGKQTQSPQLSNEDENEQPKKKKNSILERKQNKSTKLSRIIKSANNFSNSTQLKDSCIKKSKLRQIDNEQPWESEEKGERSSILLREKETVTSTAYTLANLIMSYQGDINKISKIRKI